MELGPQNLFSLKGTAPTMAKAPASTPALSDDAKQVLFHQHTAAYVAAKKAKDKAAADFRAACAKARADLGAGAVKMIQAGLELDTVEGEEKAREEIEMQVQVRRWKAIPVGIQGDIFADRMDAIERATAEGRRDGLAGKTASPPYDPAVPQHQAYMVAWHDGNRSLLKIKAGPEPVEAPKADANPSAPGKPKRQQPKGKGDDDEKDVRPRHLRAVEKEREPA